ncbi:MAG: hypothetical protein A3D92_21100 [Bacteroidetes bacterium RIFCSPHIGHO2_02_FULL_44_7]|nr:MAG: hypothetical protein A3D92_21100 [Bacteroidetes bacterium RIFCSPHIGHO2_02_FULL_44_7]
MESICLWMVAEPSRFDLLRFFRVLVFILVLGACTHKVGPSPYSVQYGILSEDSQVHVQEVKLDSIQFADAKFRYTISGHATIAGTHRDFFIVSIGHPFDGNCTIISHTFPLADVDSSDYNCSMYSAEENFVIDWIKGVKRLKLVFPRSLISKG